MGGEWFRQSRRRDGGPFFVSAGGASPKHHVHRMSKKRRVSVDMSDLDVFRIVFGSFVALLMFGHLSLFQCVRVIAI